MHRMDVCQQSSTVDLIVDAYKSHHDHLLPAKEVHLVYRLESCERRRQATVAIKMEPRTTTSMFAAAYRLSSQHRTISSSLTALLLILIITLHPSRIAAQSTTDNSVFQYTRGPVPDDFDVGEHYPARSEVEECRPIRLRIGRDSRLFRTNLVVNSNPNINFASSDAKRMTSRLQSRLNSLASLFYSRHRQRLTVHLAWVEYSPDDDDGVGDPQSLHYEGRTVRVSVRVDYMSELLQVAIEAGFDWVYFASHSYVRLSVIPDVCDANVDMVFMLDQSGSVGRYNHNIALYFLRDVVSFYNISPNATQVGLVTFSSGASIRFDLDDHSSLSSLFYAISQVRYTGGWTTTAFALALTQRILNPSRGYGARPFSLGVPKVAVLLTDGRSNLYPIHEIAPLLRNSGVQVYTVGIGNIYLPELQFIASDPDRDHVFLLNSYSDAPAFVDFLSFTTCDTPAIVEPGDNTTTEVEEDGFRFFQSACPAFSLTIMIEQIDLIGSCSLYASNQVQNPGPLSPGHLIVSNEDRRSSRRSVYLSLSNSNKFVYVSVRGHASRNHFSVIIWDMIFEEDLYAVPVSEGVSDLDVFDLNNALRMTNVTFNYTITSGNEAGFFAIDSLSGLVSLTSPLNASVHDYFLLTIVAQNSEFSCHRGRVKIKIIVVRSGIDFTDIDPVSIPENAEIGSPVTQIQVLDDDGTIAYSITGGNIGNAFAINSSTGDVTVASQLDFEMLASYSLSITAVSTITGGSATATLQVNILDVNEAPFFTDACAQFGDGSCVFSLLENQMAGILVGNLTGDDPDRLNVPNGMLTFSIQSAAGGFLPFDLVQNDREVDIITSAVLDREDQMTYSFIVRVNDGGSPSLFADVPVVINVIDVNDNAPIFVQSPLLLTISEATTNGTIIASYTATDADSSLFGAIIYSISSTTDPLPFVIDPLSGELIVSAMLDFEQVTLYTVNVTASNPDGLQSTTNQTFISIQDENDNPPIFSDAVYFGNVTEHAPGGSAILTVTATDADSADNRRIVFSIIEGNFFDLLAVDTIGGGLGVIRVAANADINREIIDLFNLTIRANDLGSPQMEDFAQVVIVVDDINDNPPVFQPNMYRAMVREDAGPFTAVQSIFAIDLDQPGTPNSEIDYEITTGNIGGVFGLNQTDNNNAEIQVIGSLDFETRQSYLLIITASDRVSPQLSGTAEVLIMVTDVNVEPPVVIENQTVSLSELTPLGTQIARINATDFDSPQLVFTITAVMGEGANGNAIDMFSIDNQGIIRLEALLNFEQSVSFEIEVTVSDGVQSTTMTIFINVVNENEFDPVFDNPQQPLSVREQLPPGAPVGTVTATDADRNSSITYSIVMSRPSFLFAIDSQRGTITTTEVLDREVLVERDLFLPTNSSATTIIVQAVDDGMPSRFTMTEVTIILEDINDNAPVFDMIADRFQASVIEERPAGTIVVNALARDLDLGVNGEVNYTLEVLELDPPESPPPFEIDPETGLVTTTIPLDREAVESYVVLIRAFDNGEPSLSTNATVNIAVGDVNDNAPIFALPVYEISVLENATFPKQLLQVEAFDEDLGTNAEISYRIQEAIPANSTALFSINLSNGTISLVGMLDAESRDSHRLIIAADDGVNSNTTEVIISVVNVDETPPEFFGLCAVSIPESFVPVTPITQCSARDLDDSTNQVRAAERYELVSGNIDDTFSIGSDGTIFLVRNVDRETISFYNITVRAFDRVGLSNTTQLSITILDINDNPPIFQNIPETLTITQTEIQSQTTSFFTVLAADADFGANANIVYSLMPRRDNNSVTELTITASDQGMPQMSATAVLTYQFEVPCMLQEHSIDPSSGEVISQLLCEVSIEPPTNNLILGTNLPLMCVVLRNVEATFEFLHNGSLVTSAIPLDPLQDAGVFLINGSSFQDAGEYACKVTALDVGSLQSDNAIVNILVPPVITIPPESTARELGLSISFSCFASGVPQPTISWSRQTAQGREVLTTRPRILVSLNFLVISGITSEDQGTYICSASNGAATVEASAMLTVISQSNVIVMDIANFSSPSQDHSCHHFNTSNFESAMSTITGVVTMTTSTNGSALCNESACSPSPCENGGECTLQMDVPRGYVCSCSIGYTGVNCETDIDECQDGPCQFGGTCTNTEGSFMCECPSGYKGHRCQYTTVCNDAQDRCPGNQTCVETISNTQGFVCADATSTGAVVVMGITSGPGHLDDQVNNIQEMASTTVTRSRRQTDNNVISNNGFVTNCEARFMPVQSTTAGDDDGFVLVWACPEGVESPDQEDLDGICQALFSMGLVNSCSSPSGLVFTSTTGETSLANTSVSVFFVLVDEDGVALSGAEALDVLGRSDVLARIRGYGYLATGYAAVIPPSLGASKTNVSYSAMIAGVLVALVLAVLLSVMVFSLVCIVKQRHFKKKGFPPLSNSIHNIYQHTRRNSSLHRHANQQSHASRENLIEENPYVSMARSTSKKNDNDDDTSSDHANISLQDLFDDGIYGKGYIPPPVKVSPENSRVSSPFQRPPSYKEVGDDACSSTSEATVGGGRERTRSNGLSKRSSLERLAGRGLMKVPSLRRKTESKDNLLENDSNDDDDDDHDYDDVIVNVPALIMAHNRDNGVEGATTPTSGAATTTTTQRALSPRSGQSRAHEYRDDEIYGNLPYTREGGTGNAGQRWESYWKTQTLLRSPDQGQRSAGEMRKVKNTAVKNN